MRALILPMLLLAIPATAQVNSFDSRIDGYVGLRYPCDGSVQPVLRIQNVGGETMTSCDIDVLKNGFTETTFNWVLGVPAATNEFRQPALPEISGVLPGDVLEFQILTVNGQPDEGATENILQVTVNNEKGDAPSPTTEVKILTDDNPEETTWTVKNALGVVVAQGGPYVEENTEQSVVLSLPGEECLNFEVYDSGGDGLAGTRSAGYAKLMSQGEEVASVSGDFGDLYRYGVVTGNENGCYPSQLTNTPEPVVSCGAQGLRLNGTNTLYATEVAGANRYQFHFTNIPGQPAYFRNIATPTRSLLLTQWATKPLKYGRTYNVEVRSSFDNGASWCAYGPSCTIRIRSTPMMGGDQRAHEDVQFTEEAPITFMPNPVDDGLLTVLWPEAADASDPITIELFDAVGRSVIVTTRASDGSGLLLIDLSAVPPGIYVVRATAGEMVAVDRLSIR